MVRPCTNVARIDIGFLETDDISINVWLPGCRLNCKNCFSPELKRFDCGEKILIDDLIDAVRQRSELTKTVCLIGGNPPDNENINEIAAGLKKIGMTVWLYTGYEFSKIQNCKWLQHCDYVKTGPYISELDSNNYRFASTNQKLFRRIDGVWKVEEELRC
jgi:anaerobic ribonucleoside-triphosphate reductase activating protein